MTEVDEKTKPVNTKEEEGYVLSQFEKMICKMTEIQSMMKNGEFIIAYEKIGGVMKNLLATGGVLQRRFAREAVLK